MTLPQRPPDATPVTEPAACPNSGRPLGGSEPSSLSCLVARPVSLSLPSLSVARPVSAKSESISRDADPSLADWCVLSLAVHWRCESLPHPAARPGPVQARQPHALTRGRGKSEALGVGGWGTPSRAPGSSPSRAAQAAPALHLAAPEPGPAQRGRRAGRLGTAAGEDASGSGPSFFCYLNRPTRFLFSARVSLTPLLEDAVWTSLMTPKRQKAVRRLVNLVHDTWRTRALESKSPSFLGSRIADCQLHGDLRNVVSAS